MKKTLKYLVGIASAVSAIVAFFLMWRGDAAWLEMAFGALLFAIWENTITKESVDKEKP